MPTILTFLNRTLESLESYNQLLQSAERHYSIARVVKESQEFIEKLIKENKHLADIIITKITPYLANRGWYLAGQLPGSMYCKLAKAIEEERHDEVEKFMQEFTQTRFDAVIEHIERLWPNRRKIICDAIEAHKENKFTLSVPAFLSQADGICCEIFEKFLFTKSKGSLVEKLNSEVRPSLSPLAGAFLDALCNVSSLQTHTKSRDKKRETTPDYGPLNRHGVLHGIHLDYDTVQNSLRALLLIDYLIEIKNIVDRYNFK